MNYHRFHERSQAAWEAQRVRLETAAMLTEREFTESELAEAAAVLTQAVDGRQKELFGGKNGG